MPEIELIDTHCHLTYGKLGEDADGAWARARDAGVVQAVVVGIDAASSRELVGFVAEREGLHCSVGIHPNAAGAAELEDLEVIAELARAPGVVAIGETGIDLYRERASLERQVGFLKRQVEIALAAGLPVILHVRDAYPETIEVLEPFVGRGLRAVVHCFAGGPEELSPFVAWGFLISFSGVLTYPSAQRLREAARQAPRELCVVETDAPWLAPAPHRGATNEPAFVRHTAEALAEVWGISSAETAAITTANARRFFGLPEI
jgi:TatD DNase family protein